MNIPRILNLSAFAAVAMALVTGCSPKSSIDASAPPATHSAPNPVPVVQYQFPTPGSEQDLQTGSRYGFLIVKTVPGFRESSFARLGLQIKGKLSLKGSLYYKLYKDADVLAALKTLQVTKGVLFAEPDQLITADAGITYNNPDPLTIGQEYSVYLTKLKDAWTTYGFGANTPTVVDIDTGIRYTHEDFQAGESSIVSHAYSWWDLTVNPPSEIITGNNYATDPIDYLGVGNTDENGHGTHTAGTIAAQGNNGVGVAGVNWKANLVSYKGLLNGSGDTWAIYGSLYHLLNWKLSTNYTHTIPVNMSLGGSGASQFAVEVVEACTENNIVIIASMGNTGDTRVQYPAGYQGVIPVGASNGQDKKVHFSTSGPHISVVAPGFDVISTGNLADDYYLSESGTSMSAPFVTGLVSYMLTFNPDLTPAQIRTYLEQNADKIEGATGFNFDTGWGRVNALKTIAAVIADVNGDSAPASNYVNVPLKVTVQNTFNGSTNPLPGVPVYLYHCDPIGLITNFVACSVTSGDPGGDPLLPAAGEAHFNLLLPGTYVARTNISGVQGHSELITVGADTTDAAITVNHKSRIYLVQTIPDAGTAITTDDQVFVYDNATLTPLAAVDIENLDTAMVMTTAGQALLINIRPYSTFLGEYALWVGTDLYGTFPAPGTAASPAAGGFAGSTSQSYSSPQALTLDTLYNGVLTTAGGDFYLVTVP